MALCILIFSSSVFAEDSGPRQVIERIFENARKPEIVKNRQLQNSINAHVDFEQMAKSVLASHYASLAKNDQDWFVQTLKSIITQTIYPKAPGFFSGVKLSYEKSSEAGAKASLLSIVEKKGEETEVLYSFHRIGDQWKIVDIAIDEESWVDNIKSEVQGVWQKEKWTGLKKRLQERLAKLETGSK